MITSTTAGRHAAQVARTRLMIDQMERDARRNVWMMTAFLALVMIAGAMAIQFGYVGPRDVSLLRGTI